MHLLETTNVDYKYTVNEIERMLENRSKWEPFTEIIKDTEFLQKLPESVPMPD